MIEGLESLVNQIPWWFNALAIVCWSIYGLRAVGQQVDDPTPSPMGYMVYLTFGGPLVWALVVATIVLAPIPWLYKKWQLQRKWSNK